MNAYVSDRQRARIARREREARRRREQQSRRRFIAAFIAALLFVFVALAVIPNQRDMNEYNAVKAEQVKQYKPNAAE